MRRSTLSLPLVLAAFGIAAFASCSSSNGGGSSSSSGSDASAGGDDAGDDGQVPTPPAWDQPVTRPDDPTANAGRAACQYKRGDMPAATLGPSFPIDSDMPIDNIVVVMMENHSFDSYFGHLGKYANRTDIESAPDTSTNPGVEGGTVPWQHAPHLCSLDTNHEWAGTHQEIDDGAMDGFVKANEGWDVSAIPAGSTDPALASGARAMWWYDETDIPFYYQLASTYALADHYHVGPGTAPW